MQNANKKIILSTATLAAVGLTGMPAAQAATTGVPVKAIVLAPVDVTQTQSLNFGSLTEASAGTLAVGVAGGAPVAGGGVTSIGGTIQPGGFKLVGTTARNITVTAPNSVAVSNGTATMNVTGISIASPGPANTTTGTLTTTLGAATVSNYRLGGTLNVGAGQATGTYTGTVTVTANYQ